MTFFCNMVKITCQVYAQKAKITKIIIALIKENHAICAFNALKKSENTKVLHIHGKCMLFSYFAHLKWNHHS